MKKHLFLAGLLCVLSASLFGSDDVRGEKGAVLIVNVGPDRVIVGLDSANDVTDGLVDQWFVLQTSAPSELPLPIYLRTADVRFREGYVRVIAPTEQTVYDFVVNGVKIQREVPPAFRLIRTEGYGLSHNKGETNISVEAPCDGCEALTQDWSDAGEMSGGGTSSCTAGGIGAKSCSISSGTRSCQVSCDNYTFACCKTTTTGVSCKCVL